MVAHTGFEPVISALRGRCPRPLDECATLNPSVYYPFFLQFLPRCSKLLVPFLYLRLPRAFAENNMATGKLT